MYYFYSCISGSLEIGIIYGGICRGFPLWKVLVFGLMYQAGNLVPVPCALSKMVRRALTAVLVGLWCVKFCSGSQCLDYLSLLGIVGILSGLIQSMRSGFAFTSEKWKKRFFRVLGFGTAFFYGIDFTGCIAAVSVVMIVTEFFRKSAAGMPERHNAGKAYVNERQCERFQINRTMLFHQMHYFVYAYAMLELSCGLLEQNSFSILFFVISWLTYLMTEPVLRRYGHGKWRLYMVTGHVMLAVLLFLVSCAAIKESGSFFLVWALSGFGGGTVFCIKLVEQAGGRDVSAKSWTLSENLGHILGVLTACIWTALGYKAIMLPIAGGSFALLTVWSAVRTERT